MYVYNFEICKVVKKIQNEDIISKIYHILIEEKSYQELLQVHFVIS